MKKVNKNKNPDCMHDPTQVRWEPKGCYHFCNIYDNSTLLVPSRRFKQPSSIEPPPLECKKDRMRVSIIFSERRYTVRAPIFGRHQFFGTSEHYGKAHGSLLSGWINYNYTACCWFPTSSNILILPSQFWQISFESCWLHCSQCRILAGAFTVLFGHFV